MDLNEQENERDEDEKVESEEEEEKDEDEDEDDLDDDDDKEEGSDKEPSALDKITKPIKKRVKRTKKKVVNAVRVMQSILILGGLFVLYLTWDFISEDLIPSLQGQTEVEVVHKEIINNGECFLVRIDTGDEFCVKQRDYPFFNVGDIHYIAEVDGFNRLEVKKDEIRDYSR